VTVAISFLGSMEVTMPFCSSNIVSISLHGFISLNA